MNAKQFAYIMSRLFAVYLIYNIVPQIIFLGFTVPQYYQDSMSGNSNWISWAINVSYQLFFLFLVYIFWVKAAWFANRISDPFSKGNDAPESNLPWEVLGIAIVGCFALKDGLIQLVSFGAYLVGLSSSSVGVGGINFKTLEYSRLAYPLADFLLAFVFLVRPKRFIHLIATLRNRNLSRLSDDNKINE